MRKALQLPRLEPTEESVFLNRRRFLETALLAGAGTCLFPSLGCAQPPPIPEGGPLSIPLERPEVFRPTDPEGMIREGRHWASLHDNIVVKCPCTPAGLQATRALSKEGHRVNVTLVFSAPQGLLAAKAGAAYCSPFIGRLDDISAPGMEVVADLVQIYRNYSFPCEVLAASLRHPRHVVEAAKIGSHVATMPFKVFSSLIKHPLTDIGLKRFLDDWEKAKKEIGAKAAG